MHPPRLIKTFSKNSDANNFAQGTIILRCLNYFRMCEDERGDNNESTVKHLGPGSIPTMTTFCNDAFILSLWTPPLIWEKECNKFGKHHVEIIDPCALFSTIQEKLKNILLHNNNAYFGAVSYMDYGENMSDLEEKKKVLEIVKKTQFFCEKVYLDTVEPLKEDTLGIEYNFTKCKEFQEEKETRMVFLFKLTDIKEALIHHGDIQVKLWKKETEYDHTDISFTTITKVTQIWDYDIWRADRCSQGTTHHWVEVTLSNLPTSFFSLLS